jgi:hypothetical protein
VNQVKEKEVKKHRKSTKKTMHAKKSEDDDDQVHLQSLLDVSCLELESRAYETFTCCWLGLSKQEFLSHALPYLLLLLHCLHFERERERDSCFLDLLLIPWLLERDVYLHFLFHKLSVYYTTSSFDDELKDTHSS